MLTKLFTRCLEAEYTHTPDNGDYAIEAEDDTLYLLFEWSDGKEDWRNNFDFPAKPYSRMDDVWFCHRGFLRVWKAMRDEIEAKVKELLDNHPEIKNITCIGYSHGGAIAVFATEDMEYLHGETYAVTGYGFGAPRVLWGGVPQTVTNRLKGFRVIRNIPDIVTHLPPAIFGFKHAGEIVTIGEDGKYGPITAHKPDSYINELE